MFCIRPSSVILSVFGVVGTLWLASARAADLTIPSGPGASVQKTMRHVPERYGKPHKDMRAPQPQTAMAHAEQHHQLIVPVVKQKRTEKGKRKIRTYNLFHDPVFKLSGAVTSHSALTVRPGEAAPHIGALGSGYNDGIPASMPAGMIVGGAIKSTLAESRASTPRIEKVETDGLEFACREKAFTPSYIRRDMSACYQSSLDKSWRTRTFVSKGITDGGREWGGGLSLIYAH